MSLRLFLTIACGWLFHVGVAGADRPDPQQVRAVMRQACEYYHGQVASHGGYVYHYTPDLQTRWGEGKATRDQVWVQPPGTPTVGLAYLAAFRATQDDFYRRAAVDAANAIVQGQLKSGGWAQVIDFDPKGTRVADYRNRKGSGRNHSSLDDGQTQSALLLLIETDHALAFKNDDIHQSAMIGLDALLLAQFSHGGFPQVWTGPSRNVAARTASYPDHRWQDEGRIKNYWDMATINDNVPGYIANTLSRAHDVYRDERYLMSLLRLGDFLLLAQMPQPQPGWAQQYNDDMQPIWARPFEPPAVSGGETQDVVETLLLIAKQTGQQKYIEPIGPALDWLERSTLPNGMLARYYELRTNRPLYMRRRGRDYHLTHSDQDLPSHYAFQVSSRITSLREDSRRFGDVDVPGVEKVPSSAMEQDVRQMIGDIDDEGRWVSSFDGERLVGQPKFDLGQRYIASQVFCDNVARMSEYLIAVSTDQPE